jgi:hypothetical protein
MSNEQSGRPGGSWIGQHPDENTEQVREDLDEGAERVAATQNESDDADPSVGAGEDG